jgi:hypothetical protein
MYRDEKIFSRGNLTEGLAKRWVEIKNRGLKIGKFLGS